MIYIIESLYENMRIEHKSLLNARAPKDTEDQHFLLNSISEASILPNFDWHAYRKLDGYLQGQSYSPYGLCFLAFQFFS